MNGLNSSGLLSQSSRLPRLLSGTTTTTTTSIHGIQTTNETEQLVQKKEEDDASENNYDDDDDDNDDLEDLPRRQDSIQDDDDDDDDDDEEDADDENDDDNDEGGDDTPFDVDGDDDDTTKGEMKGSIDDPKQEKLTDQLIAADDEEVENKDAEENGRSGVVVVDNNMVDKSIQVLRAFTPHTSGPPDPVLALNTFYQKQGVISISNLFTDHKVSSGAFWTSFECPLTGKEYTSGLPLVMFTEPVVDDRLQALAHKIFGNFTMKRDQVVFTTKKGAKRAVAFVVLQAHQQTGFDGEHIFVSSVEGGAGVAADEMESPVKGKTSRRVPGWVHELHAMGVEANSIEISYREHCTSSPPLTPCQLCCILSIRKPIPLVAISIPCTSKRLAIENAVLLLTEELKRSSSSSSTSRKPLGISQLIKIHNRDACNATYIKPLPRWANEPVYVDKTMYLYRLQFLTSDGADFMSSRSGLDVSTPLGIIFASDLPRPISNENSFQAQFDFLKSNRDKHERVTVKLSDRTEIQLSSLSVASIQAFNKQVFLWKDYGQQSSTKQHSKARSTYGIERTYMFVPIQRVQMYIPLSVDLDLIHRIISEETTSYTKRIDQNVSLPIVGEIGLDLSCIAITLAWFGLMVLTPDIYQTLRDNILHGFQTLDLTFLTATFSNLIGSTFLFLALMTLLFHIGWPPSKQVDKKTLQNRFFVERKPGAMPLYVTPSRDHFEDPFNVIESHLTGKSNIWNPKGPAPSEEALAYNFRKFHFDLRKAKFTDLYRQKYGIALRHPRQRIINAIPLNRHTEQDFLFRTKKGKLKYVIPELVEVLPYPRDLMYILKEVPTFMPALERVIELDALASDFHAAVNTLAADSTIIKPPYTKNSSSSSSSSPVSRSLVSLLDEALTVSTYQRLEFLGDSVLGYFLALNLMARNSSLTWDIDDLAQIHSDAGNNRTLFEASMRIGAGKLLIPENRTWRSSFQPTMSFARSTGPKEMMQIITQSRECDFTANESIDKTLSDIGESLLGAAFLFETSGTSKCIRTVVGLFEGMKLPLSEQEEESNAPWFRCTSPCFFEGYDFSRDTRWETLLIEIRMTLSSDKKRSMKLNNGAQGLVNLLIKISGDDSLKDKLGTEHVNTLLLCSLFDDSLRHEREKSSESTNSESQLVPDPIEGEELETVGLEKGVFRAALLRDTLNLVGGFGLQLCFTEELFRRYPAANEGDLHILRSCALADDIGVYIMFKAGFQKFLYDQNATSISKFQSMVEMADVIGKQRWLKNGGWLLNGGTSEFAARCRSYERTGPSQPQYCGIGGGRLILDQKGGKQKLPEALTSDLSFSYKTMIGALVLALGLDGMWGCIGPLYQELLVLSANEIRQEFKGKSSIIC